jgi:exosortase K
MLAAVEAPGIRRRVIRRCFMKTKFLWFTLALTLIWAMKRYYSVAGADDLWWILSPTARLAGGMTGASFVGEPGAGYLSREHLFLIEKSCAGINFMIAAFGMLMFALGRRVKSFASGAIVLAVSILAGYSAAIIVNAARITIAMALAAQPFALSQLSPAQIHRLEGICVYFAGLVVLYELVLWVERRPEFFRSKA